MRRRPSSVVLALTVVALALTGCSGQAASPAKVEAAGVAASPSASPSAQPSTEASPSAEVSPSAAESPPAPPSPPAPASPASPAKPKASAKPAFAYDVAAVQRKLTDLGYFAGAIDGRPGAALASAVMGFQKVQELGLDGVVGPTTLAALDAPKVPSLKGSAPADRVEVDLTKQVLYVVKGGQIVRIMPVSSGNGATYKQKNGAKARALTPSGYYTIERRIVGERVADLGTLYDPQYFYRGWAIHGSNSVPAGPASHGCIRVSRANGKYLLQALNTGMGVFIYGGQYTFSAGSSAPGTDSPTGDGAGDIAPGPVAPAPPPAPAQPAPAPTQPSPAVSPSPANPTPSPSPLL